MSVLKREEKIKICFVSTSAYPLFNKNSNAFFGGAEVNMYYLAKKIAEDPDFDVTVCVGDYNQKPLELYDGVKVRKLKYQPMLFGANNKKYETIPYKILRQIFLIKELVLKDYDVYINTCGGGMITQLVLLGKLIRRKKVIFRMASDSDAQCSKFNGRFGRIKSWIYTKSLKSTSLVVAQTEKQQKMLNENIKVPSVVISNGFFIKDQADVTEKAFTLWVSRSDENKRPELFLELAARLPHERFVIIIPGDNATKTKAVSEAKKLKNVEILDFVPFSQIQDYYEKAKVFVNTSVYEGFPNSFIQSFLAGTPILSFNVNPDEIITKYDLGYLCNNNIDDAVDFIKGLDDTKIKHLGKNCLDYVRKKHDIIKSADKYKENIKKLLER
ncbi:glycosyltransferase family 4 protein [Pseudobacteroides cellulosolvens]|uniref:Glycosyl transferase group 1 n=1 Tax=Pseudobacteroides cellulosolvens ATCC 35603 = DSM 2933 TaxID=398512 RepID=A0A0L6JLF8_9FIRM|nr:glycosyltransferase family 4 protein [Pseudobacteroides cellulosolvens]KNY26593.1 glycosyl transferase group 1 [Pseudobacteroides cellulosolvens ATCC 35603 = DSM 2933]